jgi:hypothetical protein
MGAMVPAIGIEAVFEGKLKDDKTYRFSRAVQFWYDGGNGPVGMYIDDSGKLMAAESRANFLRYSDLDESPVVTALHAGDLCAVYRDDDGTLNRTDISVLIVGADGNVRAREIDSEGAGYNDPTDVSNFVGYWRKSWGDEPWKDEPWKVTKQGTLIDTDETTTTPPVKVRARS